ncbi:ferredoxin [Pelagibius sp. 7325]|uniref:ferredoxin n=1 Tax=Pelagibius sp. 7325 TaxID=3131994 RepID=UPI0030EDC366
MNAVTPAAIAAALEAEGLLLLGAFHPAEDDAVPPLADGRRCGTLVLAGNVGGSLWPVFSASPEAGDGKPDALDRWSARVLGGLAASFGGEPLYPFGGPPYRPFQRWARRGAPLTPSPLGMLIHPDYGLWHAYRGAIALPQRLPGPLPLEAAEARPAPCETCFDKPCLTTCPVGAFTAEGYDVTACAGHVAAPAGADCLSLGCRARRACPVGRQHHYPAAQARFHMAAFIAAHGF